MRALIIAAATGLSLHAHPAAAQAVDRLASCANLGALAAAVMESRQNGMAMSSVIETITQGIGRDAPAYGLLTQMVVLAYQRPRMQVERNQRREVDDFRNDIEAGCFGAGASR